MFRYGSLALGLFLLLSAGSSAQAQEAVTASRVELSIPFGVAEGQLVTVGDYVVFVNDEKPDSSFSLRKSNIVEAKLNEGLLTIRTNEAVENLNKFVFRLGNEAKAAALVAWAKRAPAPALAEAQRSAGSKAETIGEYQVRHEHRFVGACDGKLLISRGRVSFESVSEIGHSRQWDASDLKELKSPNPYKLEIRPFVGDDYDFKIVGGEGMSSREFKALTDMVATARAPR